MKAMTIKEFETMTGKQVKTKEAINIYHKVVEPAYYASEVDKQEFCAHLKDYIGKAFLPYFAKKREPLNCGEIMQAAAKRKISGLTREKFLEGLDKQDAMDVNEAIGRVNQHMVYLERGIDNREEMGTVGSQCMLYIIGRLAMAYGSAFSIYALWDNILAPLFDINYETAKKALHLLVDRKNWYTPKDIRIDGHDYVLTNKRVSMAW